MMRLTDNPLHKLGRIGSRLSGITCFSLLKRKESIKQKSDLEKYINCLSKTLTDK